MLQKFLFNIIPMFIEIVSFDGILHEFYIPNPDQCSTNQLICTANYLISFYMWCVARFDTIRTSYKT